MLGLIDRYLPLCKDEWEFILNEHNKLFSLQNRTVDALRRKFASLHRKKMPTGDPLMPANVRRAKHIRYKMTERADMGVNDDGDPDEFFPVSDANNSNGSLSLETDVERDSEDVLGTSARHQSMLVNDDNDDCDVRADAQPSSELTPKTEPIYIATEPEPKSLTSTTRTSTTHQCKDDEHGCR